VGIAIELVAEDGHKLGGYRADPQRDTRGAVIVIQEIFGVNEHIRQVCDRFAADGYLALAPALYDRSSQHNCQLGYGPEDIELGRKLREQFSWDDSMKDVEAAAVLARAEGLRVGAVGYCWGGTISYLAATRLDVQAAVVYYGGQIIPYVDERERCPLLMHFGRLDEAIPLSDVDRVSATHPRATVHLYDAGHGFNCDRRGSYNPEAAALARSRTMELFATHLG
jgi:carboxymethylenebutenolidase